MNCSNCGEPLSFDELERNEEISKQSQTKRLDYCWKCWSDYAEHAITGN